MTFMRGALFNNALKALAIGVEMSRCPKNPKRVMDDRMMINPIPGKLKSEK